MGIINNKSILINARNMNNEGVINNFAGAAFTISGNMNNNGFFFNNQFFGGTINNLPGGILTTQAGSNFNNSGKINNESIFNHSGRMNNEGTITNMAGGVLTITSIGPGIINNSFDGFGGEGIINECGGIIINNGFISGPPIIEIPCDVLPVTLPPDLTGDVVTDTDGITTITATDSSGDEVTEIILPPGSSTTGTVEIITGQKGLNNVVEITGVILPLGTSKSIQIASNPGSSKACVIDRPEGVFAQSTPSCNEDIQVESRLVLKCSAQGTARNGVGSFPNAPIFRDYTCTKITDGLGNTFLKVDGLAFSFVMELVPQCDGTAANIFKKSPGDDSSNTFVVDGVDVEMVRWNKNMNAIIEANEGWIIKGSITTAFDYDGTLIADCS